MTEPLTAPWLLRFRDARLEVRLLVQDPQEAGLTLTWRGQGSRAERRHGPRSITPTRLGDGVALVRFVVADRPGSGGRYRIDCGDYGSLWIRTATDPSPGEPWRFLVFSDHQNHPAAALTLRAVARQARQEALHGLLFAGDAASIPDDPATWYGAADGTSFLDSLAAPVARVFAKRGVKGAPDSAGAQRAPSGWPLLSTLPIFVCAGNHDISSSSGATASARFANISPEDWDIATFQALFLPTRSDTPEVTGTDPAAPPGCYAAQMGPLEILALLVARRWVPGDPVTRTGPCFEPPGRFIFQSIAPGSPQLEWLRAQVSRPRSPGALRVLLLHHPPYAQGWNCLPLFDHPPGYATHLIARYLVPIIRPWADLVISGHNHAVNHHLIDGVHYFESSHVGAGKPARFHQADGSPAPEPLGHPGLFFAGEEEATYFAVLEVTAGEPRARGRMRALRVQTGGWGEVVYSFDL
jgi:hypothetical protein